mmetsp:Transcript_4237/g.10762  ORF Transcript_4237/g.10762 Transcript_4237/m.10762 type:complete len:86 (-) Transcript_4237:1575-1832(-)
MHINTHAIIAMVVLAFSRATLCTVSTSLQALLPHQVTMINRLPQTSPGVLFFEDGKCVHGLLEESRSKSIPSQMLATTLRLVVVF